MNRLTNIQILRAVAALMVLVSHVGTDMSAIAERRGGSFAFAPAPWTSGVDLFFVVSGFIMVATSLHHFGQPGAARTFLTRRLVRIVPLYWLLTTMALVGGLVVPTLLNVPIVDLGHVVASYLFWPFPRGTGEIRPVLALGWTLNFEMFFYVLFAASLVLPQRLGLAAIAGVLIGLSAWGVLGAPPGTALAFWAQPILLEFLGGMALGLAWRAGWRVPAPVALASVIVGLALLTGSGERTEARHTLEAIAWLAPAAMLTVVGAALGPQLGQGTLPRLFGAVGDASYSLYLVHPFVIRPLRNVWLATGMPLPLYPAMALLASVAVAMALYRLFERPATDRLGTLLRRTPAARPQPAE